MAPRNGKEIRYSESVLVFGYDFPVNAAERTTFGFGHAFTLRQCGVHCTVRFRIVGVTMPKRER